MTFLLRAAVVAALGVFASHPLLEKANRLGGLRVVTVSAPSGYDWQHQRNISHDEYRIAVEARLRAAGISVEDDVENVPGRPELTISVDPGDPAVGVVAVDLKLLEDASLVRAPGKIVRALTWSGNGLAKGSAREALQKPLDEFVNDYLKVNPIRNTDKKADR